MSYAQGEKVSPVRGLPPVPGPVPVPVPIPMVPPIIVPADPVEVLVHAEIEFVNHHAPIDLAPPRQSPTVEDGGVSNLTVNICRQ